TIAAFAAIASRNIRQSRIRMSNESWALARYQWPVDIATSEVPRTIAEVSRWNVRSTAVPVPYAVQPNDAMITNTAPVDTGRMRASIRRSSFAARTRTFWIRTRTAKRIERPETTFM